MIEIWMNYPEDYRFEVSNTGRVRKGDKIKTLTVEKSGYVKTRVPNPEYVHRIVAKTWLPNPDNLTDVNHKDGNKQNNCISNLEWSSHKVNMEHASTEKLISHVDRHFNAKLDEDTVRVIKLRYTREPISPREIAEEMGLNKQAVFEVCWVKTWSHVLPELNEACLAKKSTRKKSLSKTDVEVIKESLIIGVSGIELAKLFDVSSAAITQIKNCKRHTEVRSELNHLLIGDKRYSQVESNHVETHQIELF